MGDAIDHVQPSDILLIEQIDRVRFALAENCDQHVGTVDFLFARRLHVKYRALQHSLESQRWLGVAIFIFRQ